MLFCDKVVLVPKRLPSKLPKIEVPVLTAVFEPVVLLLKMLWFVPCEMLPVVPQLVNIIAPAMSANEIVNFFISKVLKKAQTQ